MKNLKTIKRTQKMLITAALSFALIFSACGGQGSSNVNDDINSAESAVPESEISNVEPHLVEASSSPDSSSEISSETSQVSEEPAEQEDGSVPDTLEEVSDLEPAEEAEPDTLLTLDTYPRMDGSTANLPLMAEVLSETCGISLAEAETLVECSKTSQAWRNLSYGYTDIVLAYEASESTIEDLLEIGTALDIHPAGRDALVFIVNESNPVESLTIEQIRDIYTGKITNWMEVGGNDEEIVAFQRNEQSGSQSLFVKLVMGDAEPMEAPMSQKINEMAGLIDSLAAYNNNGNAIGYSVFYYASYMYDQPGLKFIQVEGVEPSDETIATKQYPLLNEYYVAIRADEESDSPARILMDWILSDEGKNAARKAGYIPVE